MKRSVSSVCPVAITILVLGASVPASAQRESAGDAQARELYLRGDRAYSEGRYEEAVTAFSESFRLSGRALLLYNLANAYERLGRYAEALDALQRYAPHAPIAESHQVRARIQALEQRAREQPRRSRRGSGDETLVGVGIGAGALGVLLAGGGVVTGVLALDARSEAQGRCTATGGVTLCDETARDALDRDTTFALLADIGITVGAAVAVTGIVLAVIGASASAPTRSSSARVMPYAAPGPGGGELGVVVAF